MAVPRKILQRGYLDILRRQCLLRVDPLESDGKATSCAIHGARMEIADIAETAACLREGGVMFERYARMARDEPRQRSRRTVQRSGLQPALDQRASATLTARSTIARPRNALAVSACGKTCTARSCDGRKISAVTENSITAWAGPP